MQIKIELEAASTLKFGLRLLLILLMAFSVSLANAQDEKEKPDKPIEMLTCKVKVLDPDGNPLEDAEVTCAGLRSKADPGSHWRWNKSLHGPNETSKTNQDGIAEMKCPKYVFEKIETGQTSWSVSHSDFVGVYRDSSVDEELPVYQVKRGFRIAVTAVDAKGDRIKSDLFGVIADNQSLDWDLKKNGTLVSPVFEKSDSRVRIIRLAEGKPTLFSEMIDIKPGDRSRVLLQKVKLVSGTRVEGKLDDSISRPVKNGYVSARIVSRAKSDQREGTWEWFDDAPIAEDGTFVFESLPPGEILQVIPCL